MKAFRGTAWLSLLVILLAGYTAWEYRNASMHAGDTDQEKRLFFFVPDDVTEFQVKRGEESLRVVRDGEEWKVETPYQDLAEKSAIDAFLYSIMIQKGRLFQDAGDAKNADLKDFGLDPAGSEIEIKTRNKTEALKVSSKNAYDGSFYVAQDGRVMLGDRGLAQIVARDPNSLRTKRMWRERDAVILSADVEVDQGPVKDKYSIVKDGDSWRIDPKPEFPLDVKKIEEWLTALHALNPAEIASEKLGEEQRREFLLLKPSLKVHVKLKKADGKDGAWNVTAGQDRDQDVFLFSSARDTVYKTGAGDLLKLRVDRGFFRDGKAPFKFPLEEAREIEASGLKIRKDGAEWKIVEPKDSPALNSDKLAQFLLDVSSLEAQEFPKAAPAKGFQPQSVIRIRNKDGRPLLELRWGDEFKARELWNKGMTFRFVKTNLEKDVLGVNSARLKSLIQPGLTAGAKENEKTEKK